jgi:hypothetical protein
MLRCTATAVAFLALSGGLHGLWTHRWEGWAAPAVRASADRLDRIPLRVGEWDGRPAETDPRTLPEEVIGRGVSVDYTNRIDGSAVTVYLACGPTDGIVAHPPSVCYPSNGYECRSADRRVAPPLDGGTAEFLVSNFTLPSPTLPTHLRVFWAWSEGAGWQAPPNPWRTFRRTPVLYKCYAIRQVGTPDEPLDGDPALRLLAALLPRLDEVLAADR